VVLLPTIRPAFKFVGAPDAAEPWALVAALFAAHSVIVRGLDHRSLESVALGRRAARGPALGEGLLIGALAIGEPWLVLLTSHEYGIEAAPAGVWGGAAARVSLLLVPAAFAEELLTRGYVFSVFTDAWGTAAALGVTSVAFGLLHLANPGATVESVVA